MNGLILKYMYPPHLTLYINALIVSPIVYCYVCVCCITTGPEYRPVGLNIDANETAIEFSWMEVYSACTIHMNTHG